MNVGNITQRVFDALKAKPDSTIGELEALLRYSEESIRSALARLRSDKALLSSCNAGAWRYRIAPGAIRPRDRRGDRRAA
jgi:hypothetical protein